MMIGWNLYGASYPWQRPDDFRCFPCRCEPLANQSLRLERCDVPDILRYKQLSLSNSTIAEIAPGALPKKLMVLALSGNPLKNLTGGLFAQMAHLQVWASVAMLPEEVLKFGFRNRDGFSVPSRLIYFAYSSRMFRPQEFHVQVLVCTCFAYILFARQPKLEARHFDFFGMKMCSQQSRYTTRAFLTFLLQLDYGQCKFSGSAGHRSAGHDRTYSKPYTLNTNRSGY